MTTIGMFDSGVGGLSVLRHVATLAPGTTIHYVADQGYAPYGERSLAEVRDRSLCVVDYLRATGSDEIVVACNTASAAALEVIRAAHPDVPVVGMEPAVKPAVEQSATGVIAVLATEATFQGELYSSLRAQWGGRATIVERTGTGLAAAVEAGVTDGPEIERLLRPHVEAVHDSGADIIVLGCTHYPFLQPAIERLLRPGVRVLDPAPAVARQAVRRLPVGDRPPPPPHTRPQSGGITIYTTGDPATCTRQADALLAGDGVDVDRVIEVTLSGLAVRE